jgi:Protein of unknown function (DUF4242)
MPRYIIERDFPGASHLNPSQLDAIKQASCDAVTELGQEIKWEYSYLTEDKIFCVFTSPDMDMLMEHSRIVGFPVSKISEIIEVIDAENYKPAELHEAWYY